MQSPAIGMAGRRAGRARWAALVACVGAIYGVLPVAPALGRAALATPAGAWALGRGALPLIGVGLAAALGLLAYRGAPVWAYAAATACAIAYGLLAATVRTHPLERVHLLEYAVVAVLAWRCFEGVVAASGVAYGGGFVVASFVGWGEEALQRLLPDRVYDVRDIARNAAAAALALVLVALWRTAARAGR